MKKLIREELEFTFKAFNELPPVFENPELFLKWRDEWVKAFSPFPKTLVARAFEEFRANKTAFQKVISGEILSILKANANRWSFEAEMESKKEMEKRALESPPKDFCGEEEFEKMRAFCSDLKKGKTGFWEKKEENLKLDEGEMFDELDDLRELNK